jgi:hypothetical protein
MAQFGNLIDEEAARLLAQERAGEREYAKIDTLAGGPVALFVKIERIGKTGKPPVKLVVGDETGHCVLNLWDRNVAAAGFLHEGDVLRVANAWVKKGAFGREVHVGRHGMIEKAEREVRTVLSFGESNGLVNLRGILEKKGPTTMYVDDVEHFTRTVVVGGSDIVLLDERARDVQGIAEGERVVLLFLQRGSGRLYAGDVSVVKREA